MEKSGNKNFQIDTAKKYKLVQSIIHLEFKAFSLLSEKRLTHAITRL